MSVAPSANANALVLFSYTSFEMLLVNANFEEGCLFKGISEIDVFRSEELGSDIFISSSNFSAIPSKNFHNLSVRTLMKFSMFM